MFIIDDIISEIVADRYAAFKERSQRSERVIRLLRKCKIEPGDPPRDFDGVYVYALIEYGMGKPKKILELFRQDEIKAAFHRAFEENDPGILLQAGDRYIESYALGDDIRDRGIDYRRELAEFSAVFLEIVRRGQTTVETLHSHKMEGLQQRLEEMIEQLAQLNLPELQHQIARLASNQTLLSPGTSQDNSLRASQFVRQLRGWFDALYDFESYEVWAEDYFEWAIAIQTRRGFDRILVRGVAGEGKIGDLNELRESVAAQRTDEGWLVAPRRISQAARDAVENDPKLFCYSFDELIDETANFDRYLDWLEGEVRRREIDKMYVPLACTKTEIDPVTQQRIAKSRYDDRNGWSDRYLNQWLDDPAKEHLSILGEFGTGKTWLAFHYAWETLQTYRAAKKSGKELPRLPLVIPLRDYAKAVTVESLFSEFFFRKHDVRLPNYKAFEQLNRMGKLLLIFDGFDEMAAKVDRQKMINNFWELAKVVVPGSKAILTCRTEHFPEAQEGRKLLGAELKASTANLTGEPPQFEVLELEKLKDAQIRDVLAKRTNAETVDKVMGNRELVDLARRPVMVELILEALPEIEAGKAIDLARIYLYAVRQKIERDIKTERTFTSMADKLYFLCELAWEMLDTEQMSLNYREFPDRIRRCFGTIVQEQKDLDHWHYDMMGQTMLVRNDDGDYSPAHRSLLEFFVAYKFASELGVLAPDFAEVAQMRFAGNLAETFGKAPLTKAVLDLLLPMLDPGERTKQRLLELILATRGKMATDGVADVNYQGGNAATLLLKMDSRSLEGRDLSNTIVLGADFTNASLRNANFTNANLTDSLFSKVFDLVSSVAFSPDGNILATAHNNGEIYLWQVADGKQLLIYRSQTKGVRSVAFSPDGNTLASGSSDGVVKLWDVASGNCLLSLQDHTNAVRSVAFSPDGNILASSSDDQTIKLWDAMSGDCLQSLQDHTKAVKSVAFSPNGNILASGSSDQTIKLWDVASGNCLQSLQGHTNWVMSVAFSPNGNILASGSSDQTIKLWDVASGNCLQSLHGHTNWVRSVAFSPDGNTLTSGSSDQTIKLWDVSSGKCLQSLQGHTNWVLSVAFSPDGNTLASGSSDQTIKLWDVASGDCLLSFQSHTNLIRSVAFSPDGNTLASGSSDQTIKLWDVISGDCLQSFQGHTNWVVSVAFSPNGNILASGSSDQTIKLWDVASGDCLLNFQGHTNLVRSIAFSPDGNTLVSSSSDQTIKLWDVTSGNGLQSFHGHTNPVRSVAFSPDGNILASGSSDQTIKLWDVASGDCLLSFQGHTNVVRSIAFSPDGNTLASGSYDETIKLWDVASGNCLQSFQGHTDAVRSVAFSPNGNTLASSGDDQRIKLWDVLSGDCLKSFWGHTNQVMSVAFSPDGNTLASGSYDGTIELWDIQSGHCLKTISNQLYAGMNIAGATGLTEAQKATLKVLGAVEE